MEEKVVYMAKLGLERIEGEDLFTEFLPLLIKILSGGFCVCQNVSHRIWECISVIFCCLPMAQDRLMVFGLLCKRPCI